MYIRFNQIFQIKVLRYNFAFRWSHDSQTMCTYILQFRECALQHTIANVATIKAELYECSIMYLKHIQTIIIAIICGGVSYN